MAPRDNGTTAAALLQRQVDANQKAQDKIDHDPEEAKAILEPHVRVDPSAGALTMHDMFGLFLQLQRDQQAMQQQLIGLLTNQKQQPTRSEADTKKELDEARAQREATLESWRTEPKEPVMLQPEVNEEKIYAVMGEYPPRTFRINGLEFPVKVGEVVAVPQSIAAMIRYSQRPRSKPTGWEMRPMPQSLSQIPDPREGMFLAGSQEISPGYAGKSGEGRLVPAAVATSPDRAMPLDMRYDERGQ